MTRGGWLALQTTETSSRARCSSTRSATCSTGTSCIASDHS
eukprot:CAMPEP_0118840838 /NCGR_PEP_ID=MMETSP1162-20130426/74301_1 /TAXON_ID=33656 /ORGANISM="Phaeocystis Sp, Strain CCMP2710" /LENGTH=40 /DNA_ID= /DNA_START= /DNA_END= /DNA_ORIENTATION=